MSYGGEPAVATYACIAYVICIVYLILQGVGVVLMLIMPPLFGGQIMIWWSTVLARILSAFLAVILKIHVDKKEMPQFNAKVIEI